MKKSTPVIHESYPDAHHDTYSRTVFGFWMFLLSDFILFGAMFATYAVLRHSTFGGPSASDILHLPRALLQTLIFLFSSFTIGMGGACAHRKDKKWTLAFFAITFVLGCIFLG
ncbi:MAG: cytochrome o ubiquinol oxidase subunit III, partial [Chlamydiota bacterium]